MSEKLGMEWVILLMIPLFILVFLETRYLDIDKIAVVVNPSLHDNSINLDSISWGIITYYNSRVYFPLVLFVFVSVLILMSFNDEKDGEILNENRT